MRLKEERANTDEQQRKGWQPQKQEERLSSRTFPHQLCSFLRSMSGQSRNSNINASICLPSDGNLCLVGCAEHVCTYWSEQVGYQSDRLLVSVHLTCVKCLIHDVVWLQGCCWSCPWSCQQAHPLHRSSLFIFYTILRTVCAYVRGHYLRSISLSREKSDTSAMGQLVCLCLERMVRSPQTFLHENVFVLIG